MDIAKKILLGFILGITVSTTTTVFASETIQAYLFPAKYVFNGQPKVLDSEYTTLNYNGHAYVPIRWIAESVGKIIKYNDDTKQISVEDTNLSKRLNIDKDFLTFASTGKIKGIEFGIGANKNEVIQNWGGTSKSRNLASRVLFMV